jgi:hypothetical protein
MGPGPVQERREYVLKLDGNWLCLLTVFYRGQI